MKRRIVFILTAALVAVLCNGATAQAAARQPVAARVDAGDARLAQAVGRDRDLRGRERQIQQFRATPPRRDNDRFLRERREETPHDSQRLRRDRRESEQDRALDAVRRGDVLPLGGIIRSVQQFCPGTFLDATLRERGRSFAYSVSILRPNGRRVTLLVDAQSGAVLRGRCN
jgi:uncharacterized membrane protein YkoI